jgi:hypothetical protein
MKRRLTGALTLVVAAAAAVNLGCEVRGEARGAADPPVVFTQEPTLVTVEPGVSVVRDADQPVYWVDSSYWVYRDNVWYRSNTYDGGWVVVEVNVVPTTIVHRDHRAYVHYHGAAEAETHPAPRMPLAAAPALEPQEHNAPPPAQAPPAIVPDRRAEGTEARGVRKEEKRPDAETKHDDGRKPEVDKRQEEVRKPATELKPAADKKPDAVRKPEADKKVDAERKPDAIRKPEPDKKPDAVQKADVGKKREGEKKDEKK